MSCLVSNASAGLQDSGVTLYGWRSSVDVIFLNFCQNICPSDGLRGFWRSTLLCRGKIFGSDHPRPPPPTRLGLRGQRYRVLFSKNVRPLLTQRCQIPGIVLQARQKKITLKNKQKLTWAAIFFIHVLKWPELKSVRAVSKFTWSLILQCSPFLHLGDLFSHGKSLEGEQLVGLAFYAGAQNAQIGQI